MTDIQQLAGLAARLQSHYDTILNPSRGPGFVSIGIGDGVLHVYERVRGLSRQLPAWIADEGVPVKFHFVGITWPARKP
jgi:hypothetical protein